MPSTMPAPRLHVERSGRGPDLLLIHGWGLHGGIFQTVAPALAARFRLHIVDLPGHGRSPLPEGDYTLEALAGMLAAAVPADSHWLGWSLGGRIALTGAALGLPIARLILVGSTPCFTRRDDWPHGMEPAEFARFAHALEQDWPSTLQRFLAIQTRGSSQAREELRLLRQAVFTHGQPQAGALGKSLKLLREADLRPLLARIKQPALLIHGARDTLSPLAAAEYSVKALPDGRLTTIAGAGHAPFLSHPDEFTAALTDFLS